MYQLYNALCKSYTFINCNFQSSKMGSEMSALTESTETTEIEDFLDITMELMYSKRNQFFSNACHDMQFQKLVPIDKVFKRQAEIRVSVDAKSGIGNDVAAVAKTFMDGAYANAVGATLSLAATTLFGQYHGSFKAVTKHAITIGVNGGIMRVDSLIYLKKIKSKRLQGVMKNILMVCYMVSSVKTDSITPNDIKVLVDISFSNEAMKKELTERFLHQLFPNQYPRVIRNNKSTTQSQSESVDSSEETKTCSNPQTTNAQPQLMQQSLDFLKRIMQ